MRKTIPTVSMTDRSKHTPPTQNSLIRSASSMDLVSITEQFVDALDPLRFDAPVTQTYNPLVYAREPHIRYLKKYGNGPREVVLLGMNPGPWGMAQTGVPFGAVPFVRDWLGIEGRVDRPNGEHPKRPVMGFTCRRTEVSGARLWGWAEARFGTASNFFERFFVMNYCPLMFLEANGANRTPDKLPSFIRKRLFEKCDEALRRMIACLRPRFVIGVGSFAEHQARESLRGMDIDIHGILHPSPASPAANRGWMEQADAKLTRIGILPRRAQRSWVP